jgi:hypothetical protein
MRRGVAQVRLVASESAVASRLPYRPASAIRPTSDGMFERLGPRCELLLNHVALVERKSRTALFHEELQTESSSRFPADGTSRRPQHDRQRYYRPGPVATGLLLRTRPRHK